MACVQILATLITTIVMSFLTFPCLGIITTNSAIIAATPAVLPNPPLSPYVAVSPDIAPLFPSPGGSSMPTIPSSRSPPNPDATAAIGPDAVMAPSGVLQDSSARELTVGGFLGCLAYWSVMFFI